MDKIELYKKAIEKWGEGSQIEMAVEECSELIQAIQKNKRNHNLETVFHICEEIADVEIILEQLRGIFESDIIDQYKTEKLERLERRIIE